MRFGVATLLALCLVAASPAMLRAQLRQDEVPLAELIDVLLVDRDVLAVNAARGGQVSERLQLDETVLWLGARGKVGVAITTRRMLGVATNSGAWQEADYLQREQPPYAPVLGDRVALILTSRRALGFDGNSGNFVEYKLGPREHFIASRVGENVAVAITDRVALGLSPLTGGFFRVKIDVGERIESISTGSNIATVTTPRRVLIFRSPSGTWEERNRDLQP
jgi:hypothetical protein